MCRKLICLLTFIIVLGTAGNASAELVGYWRLDEGSGTIANDSSGNGHNGTLEGDPQWVVGRSGKALQFDGTEDYVNIGLGAGDYFATLNSGFTVAAWVNRVSTGTYDVIFGAGRNPVGTAAGDNNNGWKLAISSGDMLAFTTLGILDYTSSVGVPTGEWVHLAATFNEDGTEAQIYLNGNLEQAISGNGPANPATGLFAIGFGATWALEFFDGMLDEVRVYDHVLTELEILAAMEGGKGYPYALGPTPEDGALVADTWVSLGWKAGDFAVSHDVYMGDNFDDVNDGTGDTFRGNQGADSLYFAAGFSGYPYPDGLVSGTTYYWRIDEVNDADPNSPWKGDVWSFTVPPRKAYNPVPNDGSNFLAADATTLSWTAGFGAKLHIVYFGDDFDTVANATGGMQQSAPTYTTDPLELDKTYYWRVDELEAPTIHTGDVWSFTTRPEISITDPNLVGWWKLDEGMGGIVLDWSGHDNDGTLANGPLWVPGNEGDALEFDGVDDTIRLGTGPALDGPTDLSAAAWIKTSTASAGVIIQQRNGGYNGEYRFMVNGNGQLDFMLYGDSDSQYTFTTTKTVNDDNWYHVVAIRQGQNGYIYVDGRLEASNTGTIRSLDSTIQVAIGADIRDSVNYFNGTIDDVRIYNRALTEDEIKQVMRGDLFVAWSPNPANGATPGVDEALPLSFSPGDSASQHDVYFGTDMDAVADADETDTTDIYRGRQSGTSYTPPEGIEWGGGPYYWRIDEYNTDGSISEGRIWRFTVADYILVDDFESYDAGDNQIWYAWHDGLGYGAPGTENYFAGNGTGAAVGDETSSSYTEESIVNGGRQSMPVVYDNNKQGYSKYSEVELTLTEPRDWTKDGVAELSLWFRGYPGYVGSFVEGPVGTYTMTASGTDITGTADEFHFAYKMLTGAGSIVARVDSVQNTNAWAKAGVMIRETLDPDSAHAMTFVTPGNGVVFEYRPATGDNNVGSAAQQTGITAPHWVKIDRSISGSFTASHSTNGTTWQTLGTPQTIAMGANVYIGLAVTSHDAALACQAVFSNVTTTGTVGPQWAHQDIGITSNAAEPLYVAVSNSAGTPAVLVNDDPAAATIDTWTEWVIPLQAFADQGIVLTDVDRIAIGMGTRGNMTTPGGSGKMFFDDIRLYRSREAAE
ncbi:MAG TPA: LamG domain-containing protein [Sedimentisphaerales bacterium]|nr:LamG domain-containing protein [Sedimentisphaerales bacterium]